jgi:hypothetical protein
MSHSELRAAPRYPFRAGLLVEWGSALLRAEVTDVSSRGMFIEMPSPLWIGAQFRAKMALADPVELECVVRRVVPARGMGVEFLELPWPAREKLVQLINDLAEPKP